MEDLKKFNKMQSVNISQYETYSSNENNIVIKMNDVIEELNNIRKLNNDVIEEWNKVFEWVLGSGITDHLNNTIEEITSVFTSENDEWVVE